MLLSFVYYHRNEDISVSIIDFGASIQSVLMKGKDGQKEVGSIILSYNSRKLRSAIKQWKVFWLMLVYLMELLLEGIVLR